MKYDDSDKLYLAIGSGRLLNIKVFLDDELIYEGRVEDAPETIRNYKYTKVEMGNPLSYFVYSKFNK